MKKILPILVLLAILPLFLKSQITEEQDQIQDLHDIDVMVSNDATRWQTFLPQRDIFTGLELMLQTVSPTGDLIIMIQTKYTEDTLLIKSVPASNITSGQWFRVPFDGMTVLATCTTYKIALIRTEPHSTNNEIWWSGGIGSGYPGETDENGYSDFNYAFKTFNMVYEQQLDQHQMIYNYGFATNNTNSHWQTFLPEINKLTTLYLQFMQFGATGTVTVELQSEDGNNTITSVTVDASDILDNEWTRFDFASPIYLNPNLIYRIDVIRSDQHNTGNYVVWRGNYMSDYPGECDVSGGWENYDYAFMTFGYLALGENEIPFNEKNLQIECFPNPFIDNITIKINNIDTKGLTANIYNLQGQIVKQFNIISGNSESILLIWDRQNDKGEKLDSGVYLLIIRNDQGFISKKIIIK